MSPEDAAALKLWSALSLLGIVLVFVGVLMEGIELVVRIVAFFRRKRLSVIWVKLPELKVPNWAHVVDHIGWFILLIGLGLEWKGHVRIEEITDRESRRLNAELTKAVDSSRLATLHASKANERCTSPEAWFVVFGCEFVTMYSCECPLITNNTSTAALRALFISMDSQTGTVAH
jgi:hypothetical protein